MGAIVFDKLNLETDDLESAGVPDSVIKVMTPEFMEKVAGEVSDLMFQHFRDAINQACKNLVLVPINEDGGLDIADIKRKDIGGILVNLKVDPANGYQVRIYRHALILRHSSYTYRDLTYQTSHSTTTVWRNTEGFSVRVHDDGKITV
jgi:hypothetical protein